MGQNEPTSQKVEIPDQRSLPARPTSVRYQVLAAACSVAVIVYIHRVGFARALPEIQTDLGWSDQNLSWLTAAFLLAYAGFEVPWGLLGDRLGIRNLLTTLVVGWSLLTGCVALVVFVPRLWMLPLVFMLIDRFFFGMFQAGAFPSLARMMTDWMPISQRASAQGFIWMSTRLGGLLIPPLLGWLISRWGGWQTPLWIVAALGFVWCLAFWPWFHNRPEEMPQVNAAECQLIVAGRDARALGHGHVPWAKMLRSRSVWCLCLMYGCGGFASNFYVTLLPTYLKKHRHLSNLATDWLSGLPFALGLVACVSGGFVSDWIIRRTGNRKWGRRLNGTIGTLLGGLGWLAIHSAHETWVLAVVLCAIFFLNDIAMGPAWAACADIGERYAGTLGGAMNMVGNLAGVIGNLLAGYLFGKQFFLHVLEPDGGSTEYLFQGNQLLFIIYACSFWLGTLCWQGVDVTKPLTQED